MRLHFRKGAPCVHQRCERHITADSGKAIKIGNFHVAEQMMRGSGRHEERALYAMIVVWRSSSVKVTHVSQEKARYMDRRTSGPLVNPFPGLCVFASAYEDRPPFEGPKIPPLLHKY